MGEVAIRIKDVSKFYKLYQSPRDRLKEALRPGRKKYHREFYALSDINIEVNRGEIIGIVGKNGSGKSTLLKLITGILKPSNGSIDVRGSVTALLELGSGFNPAFTGYQNIFFYGTILGLSKGEMSEKVGDIIAFADIGDFINQPLKTYSSGMKARLGFAVAIHIDPDILILDEVLSVGDEFFKRKCYSKMEEFFKGGKTILYVSHNADSVNRLCTRAVLLDAGKIVMDSDAKRVTTHYQRLLFSDSNKRSVSLANDQISSASSAKIKQAKLRPFEYHKENYLPGLISKTVVEYKNADVLFNNARIVDAQGKIVNLLEFKKTYQFLVNVEFGVAANMVAFGFELKNLKGVRLATVESKRMYDKGRFFSVKSGDKYNLQYKFTCLLSTGTYYLNFGVSSYDGKQQVLNRLVDALVFKAENHKGFSGGYFELVDSVVIESGESELLIEILS